MSKWVIEIRRPGLRVFFLVAVLLSGATQFCFAGSLVDKHIIGGFSVTESSLSSALKDGIKFAFLYGAPPSLDSGNLDQRKFATNLLKANVKVITAGIAYYVREWECHRTWTTNKPPLLERNSYCDKDISPHMSDEKLLKEVAAFVARTKDNPLIVGYWIRDDMPAWDEGSHRLMLRKIAQLLPSDKPAICGFGAPLLEKGQRSGVSKLLGSGWIPAAAKDYSPEGCNYVALYVYAARSRHAQAKLNRYDWTMKEDLSYVLSDLRRHGWSSQKSPLIGVVQAWSGKLRNRPNVGEVMPSSKTIALQSKAFCQMGAKGIVFYAYHLSAFLSPQTPANNPQMQKGVRAGIAACKEIWVQ